MNYELVCELVERIAVPLRRLAAEYCDRDCQDIGIAAPACRMFAVLVYRTLVDDREVAATAIYPVVALVLARTGEVEPLVCDPDDLGLTAARWLKLGGNEVAYVAAPWPESMDRERLDPIVAGLLDTLGPEVLATAERNRALLAKARGAGGGGG